MAADKLYLQTVSSAAIEPPRAWLASGASEVKKWDELTADDLVLCCTVDDIRQEANWWARLTGDRKRFVEDMTFTARPLRVKGALYGRLSARVPDTAASLVSGPLVAETLRKGNRQVDVVVLVSGQPLGVKNYSRTIVAYAFGRKGDISHEVIESVNDLDALSVAVCSNSGLTHKFLASDHDRAVAEGTAEPPYRGVDMSRVLVVESETLLQTVASLRKFAYVTSVRRHKAALQLRLGIGGAFLAAAAVTYGISLYKLREIEAMKAATAEAAAQQVRLGQEAEDWIASRPRAYAQAIGVDLKAALQQAKMMVAANLGSRISIIVQNGQVRYELMDDKEIVLTPNVGAGAQAAAVVYRSTDELLAALRAPLGKDLPSQPLAVGYDGKRFIRATSDEKNSVRYSDSVTRSSGL